MPREAWGQTDDRSKAGCRGFVAGAEITLSAGMKGVGLWHDVEIHTEAQNTEIKKLCGFVY